MKINGKTVKLTIDSSWKWCMKMWRYVDKRCDEIGVEEAKIVFCEKHKITDVLKDCFFCEYIKQHGMSQDDIDAANCYKKCPGARLAKYTSLYNLWCQQYGTKWGCNSHEFYALLQELNKKRKK